MARQARRTDGISYRSFDDSWYSSVTGKYLPLRNESGDKIKGKDNEAEAKKAFYRAAVKAGDIPQGQTSPTPTVGEVADDYLNFLKKNRSASAYSNAKETLVPWLKFVGESRKADSLQRPELRNFVQSKTTWGNLRKGNGISAVVAAFNHAVETGKLTTNQFARYKKPVAKIG